MPQIIQFWRKLKMKAEPDGLFSETTFAVQNPAAASISLYPLHDKHVFDMDLLTVPRRHAKTGCGWGGSRIEEPGKPLPSI
jgi:hypothetical protein